MRSKVASSRYQVARKGATLLKSLKVFAVSIVIAAGFLTPLLTLNQPVAAISLFNNPSDPVNNPGVCDSDSVKKLPADQQPTVCQTPTTENPIFGPNGVVAKGLSIFAVVIGIMAVIVIIISGLRMVLSGGDSNTINASRNAVIYALVGLVVAAIAQAIVTFLLSKL